MLKDAMKSLGNNDPGNTNNKSETAMNKVNLSKTQILAIIGVLGGFLDVDSVVVDKDQQVQIILAGSLKKKTELDMILDQMGTMPFDAVLKAILGRF